MATAVSIAIRRDAAQQRIQAAAITLAERYDVGEVDLAPRHKQPAIQEVMTLEAVVDFLEAVANQVPEAAAVAEPSKPATTKTSTRKS